MLITRREFLKYCAATAGALGLTASGLIKLEKAMALEGEPPVIWLQGQGCSGCSVSLLNSIYYTTIDDLLLNTIDLEYHSTLMAAAGDLAVSAAEAARTKGGYLLVVEGAIPTGDGGRFCSLWPGMTAVDALQSFGSNAHLILAVGTCAAYGGMSAGNPNPTTARGVSDIVGTSKVINLPGCPAHPDWIVGTIAYILTYNRAPRLDRQRRPLDYYRDDVHEDCHLRDEYRREIFAHELSQEGCLYELGCKGKHTKADCAVRKWNSAGYREYGVNWCVGARNPCQGCTEPDFPDGKSPFYTLENAHNGKCHHGKGKKKPAGEQETVFV